MIDIAKKFARENYVIKTSEHDTTSIVCHHGHIYADGDWLCASLNNGTHSQCQRLRRIGEPVMDGDLGELTVRFHPDRFRDVARLMRPLQLGLDSKKVA